jgi:hypothetical protein
VVTLAAGKQVLADQLPERHRKLLGLNVEAMDKGAAMVST